MNQNNGNNVPCPNFGNCDDDRVDRNNTFYTYPNAWRYRDIYGASGKSYVIDDTKPLRPRATDAFPIAVTGCRDGNLPPEAQKCDLIFKAEPSPNDGGFDQWNPNTKINEYRLLKQSIPGYPHEGVIIPNKLYNSYIKLAEIRTDIIYKYNHLLLFNAEQTGRNYFAEYIAFLTEDGTKESKKIIVGAYYSYGLYNEATATLQTIMGDDENTLAFKTYYNLLLQLHSNNLSVFEMNAQQEMIMRNLAVGNTASSSSAQGLITLVYGDSFLREPRVTEFENTTQADVEQGSTLNYTLTVYPNPLSKSASTALEVDYAITVAYQSASLQLRNHFGEVVYQHALSNVASGSGHQSIPTQNLVNQFGEIRYQHTISNAAASSGHQSIPTQNITAGLYIAQLIVDGVVVSYKLVNLLY
jgi:hypothetical protein